MTPQRRHLSAAGTHPILGPCCYYCSPIDRSNHSTPHHIISTHLTPPHPEWRPLPVGLISRCTRVFKSLSGQNRSGHKQKQKQAASKISRPRFGLCAERRRMSCTRPPPCHRSKTLLVLPPNILPPPLCPYTQTDNTPFNVLLSVCSRAVAASRAPPPPPAPPFRLLDFLGDLLLLFATPRGPALHLLGRRHRRREASDPCGGFGVEAAASVAAAATSRRRRLGAGNAVTTRT